MPIPGVVASQPVTVLSPTTSPTLSYSTQSLTWTARITNKDTTTADIKCDIDTTPPANSYGTCAYNATINGTIMQKMDGGTWYTTATATGKSSSAVISLYMAPA